MSKEEMMKFGGVVTEKRPSSRFEVTLENGHEIKAIICGKIRKNNIMIYVGDRVDVEMSPYDLTIGRIIYRHKD